MQTAVTSKYKKVVEKIEDKINKDNKRILIDKGVVKRWHIESDSSFRTMKDYKENFEKKPSIRRNQEWNRTCYQINIRQY